ncbi:MAG: phosphopantetheine-binding protein [Archangium sp.]|nr:phosphopantetheine-binding protein [Archangium sp.]
MAEQSMEQMFEMLKVHAKRIMGEKYDVGQVTLDRTFVELGIDSLYLTEIAFAVLAELDLYVPMAKVARAKNAREFLELVAVELNQ